MNGYRTEQTDDRAVQANQGITEAALDELLYRPRFPVTAMLPSGGAVFTSPPALQSSPYLAFPKAGTPMGRLDIIPPTCWINGSLTVRIVWTGDTASVNTVDWQVNAAMTARGAAPIAALLAAASVAGPVGINQHIDTTFFSSVIAVNASHVMAGVTLIRNVADAYAGEVRVTGIQLIYQPAAGH